jgi:hypothetical protein
MQRHYRTGDPLYALDRIIRSCYSDTSLPGFACFFLQRTEAKQWFGWGLWCFHLLPPPPPKSGIRRRPYVQRKGPAKRISWWLEGWVAYQAVAMPLTSLILSTCRHLKCETFQGRW